MALHWTEKKCAIARIGAELKGRSWTIYGYDPGKSDPMTDYFRAASWDGVAVCEDKYPGVTVCVQVIDYTVESHSGKDGWPAFEATPKRKGWHVEKDGEIVATGLAYMMKCSRSIGWEQHVEQVATAIERAAERAMTKVSNRDQGEVSNGVRLEHDRDWTWLFFPGKPEAEIRQRLKSMGARWSNKRQGWYFRRYVERGELAWLFADGEATNETFKEETVPLVLDDHGMDDQYPPLADAPQEETPPWKMTRLAYQKSKAKEVASGVPILNAKDGQEHKALVLEALERGEDVPERVLRDYPDLAVQFSSDESETETEQPETLTESEAETILAESCSPANNPAQTLTVDMLDAVERVVKATKEASEPGEEVSEQVEQPPTTELGKLYRDWLSVTKGDESSSPSEDRLAQYQELAEELVMGGKRQEQGSEFRRFCRVRLAGRQAGFDLRTAGESFQNGKDFPVPDGWEYLDETVLVQAEFEQWELHLLTGRVDKRGSAFFQALKAITRPGALQLALEQVNGDARRRELIEDRLAKLIG